MAPTSSSATFGDGKKEIGSIRSKIVTVNRAVDLQPMQTRLVNREISLTKFFPAAKEEETPAGSHRPGGCFISGKSCSNPVSEL